MTIPLLVGGRAQRASSADLLRKLPVFGQLRTPKFRNPLPYPARTAVLGYRLSGNQVRTFRVADSDAIQAFRPALLVGDLADLYNTVPPADLKAVVILSNNFMTATDRDRLWGRFQVPAFEQLVDHRLRVLAEECEAHCGLHVLDPSVSGLRTSVECECGRTEPRIVVT